MKRRQRKKELHKSFRKSGWIPYKEFRHKPLSEWYHIDEELRPFIKVLNDGGFMTVFCCSGTLRHDIQGSPYIAFLSNLPIDLFAKLHRVGWNRDWNGIHVRSCRIVLRIDTLINMISQDELITIFDESTQVVINMNTRGGVT